jgi:hypothetical protein
MNSKPMSSKSLNTAVLMLVFNRPEVTERVFQMVRRARPKRLYISADGPRGSVAGEAVRCTETRKIFDRIDWDCEVKTKFSRDNKGCRRAVADGIGWFFDNEKEGIILEDDCLPSISFFRFCDEMLERYRDDERIMHINGNNFGTGDFIDSPYSYHFSSYGQVWGWASWSRAWKLYQKDLGLWQIIRNGEWLRNMGWDKKQYDIQASKFERMTGREAIDTWDFQWHFTLFINNGLAITPKLNLVSNLGFGPEATHTKDIKSQKSEIQTGEIQFPLIHPEFVRADYRLDEMYSRKMIQSITGNPVIKFWRLIRKIL